MSLFPVDFNDKKPLGKSSEEVSAIGIGTWAIRNYCKAEEALIYAIELGLNMIDTAEMYDAGKAEELINKVIKKVGKENVFITTKLLPERFTNPDKAIKAAENSLRRLGLKTVDLILIHWPSKAIPIKRQISSLEAIANRGLTRYIGVSNFTTSELMEAVHYTRKYEIVVNQVKYSVLDRDIEHSLLPYAIKEGITIQAYTPLEKGYVARDERLIKIGKKYGKTAVQVALNFLISRPRVTAIPKTERKERVLEFKGSLGWRLSINDIKYIEKYI